MLTIHICMAFCNLCSSQFVSILSAAFAQLKYCATLSCHFCNSTGWPQKPAEALQVHLVQPEHRPLVRGARHEGLPLHPAQSRGQDSGDRRNHLRPPGPHDGCDAEAHPGIRLAQPGLALSLIIPKAARADGQWSNG